tara:strand:+ start:319 stop:609 length:291 start_codon:yes stop_codon:yes gene_type:complete
MDYWLLASVAVWRITRMLWTERGPLDIFTKVRAKLAQRQKRMGGMFDLVSCFYCLSIWVAVPLALLLSDSIATFVISVFALSGIASLLHELIGKLK